MTGPIEEQPSLWQQSELLNLISAPPASVQPKPLAGPIGPSPPADHQPTTVPADSPPRTVRQQPEQRQSEARQPQQRQDGEQQLQPQLPPLAPSSDRGRPIPTTLLILDTETTGLEPASAQCIEVGAVLFHVPMRAVLSQLSFLLPAPSNSAEAINGIPAAVTQLSQPWQAGLLHFEALLSQADALLAHNAAFDAQWFGHGPLPPITKPWICSMDDIPWPAERNLRPGPSVRDLALAYGVPVWAAHRALTDCTYLVHVLQRCDDLEALLAAALEPRLLYRANLSYAERHRAKEAGFRWNEPVRGAWSRRLSEREVRSLGFPVQRVDADSAAA